jgi:hypothetical protein
MNGYKLCDYIHGHLKDERSRKKSDWLASLVPYLDYTTRRAEGKTSISAIRPAPAL